MKVEEQQLNRPVAMKSDILEGWTSWLPRLLLMQDETQEGKADV